MVLVATLIARIIPNLRGYGKQIPISSEKVAGKVVCFIYQA
jgi:hypothetical protein